MAAATLNAQSLASRSASTMFCMVAIGQRRSVANLHATSVSFTTSMYRAYDEQLGQSDTGRSSTRGIRV